MTRMGHGRCWVFIFMTRILSQPRNPPQSHAALLCEGVTLSPLPQRKHEEKEKTKIDRLVPRPLLLNPAIPALCRCLLFHFHLIVRSRSQLLIRTSWADILS